MTLEKAILKVFPDAPIGDIMDTIERFDIQNPIEFIAQIAHESGNFRTYSENLNYSAQSLAKVWPNRFAGSEGTPNEKARLIARNPKEIANAVYNGRMGNQIGSNDGWDYRGRGAIQITGKSNYKQVGEVLFGKGSTELLDNPDCLSKLPYAILSAGAYWKMNKLSTVHDFKQLTKRINGGFIGLEERLANKEKLENALAL